MNFSLRHVAEETYRIPEDQIRGIPPIPTQPIGFEDAQALIWFVMMQTCPRLKAKCCFFVFINDKNNNTVYCSYRLSELGGAAAPEDWQGGFHCTYNFGGPGFKNGPTFNSNR